MWNAGLDEAQAGIKVAGGNINNLRYADDTTLMAESEEQLKSLTKSDSEKAGLKLNLQKTKIMASSPITSWQTDEEVPEPDMEQRTASKLGKEYDKAVYCHTAYLTYMQSTPWETFG